MLRSTMLLAAFSFLTACAHDRPKAYATWINTGFKNGVRQYSTRGYHMQEDYDNNFRRRPGAAAVVTRYETCNDFAAAMNGRFSLDAQGQEEVKRVLGINKGEL